MTEKECLASVFLAIAALAEKLTGEKLTISITDQNGAVVSLCGEPHCVTWTPAEQPERVARNDSGSASKAACRTAHAC